MEKHNIALLYGGKSGEHEVSLRSASSVEKHLNRDLYNITLIGIDKVGTWYLQRDYSNNDETLQITTNDKDIVSLIPGRGLFVDNKKLAIDFIFPILHGTFGEDGTLQGLLDIIDIPYAGSGIDGSFMAMDKEFAKIVWQSKNLPLVPFLSVKKVKYSANPEQIQKLAEDKFKYPMFVKPVKAGSSVGVSMVKTSSEFTQAVETAFIYDNKILIEPGINAREIECSVIGNSEPEAFTLGEIAPANGFYDYKTKYIDPDGAKLIIPAELNPELAEKIKKVAKEAYLALDCKGFSRVDFFLEKDSENFMLNEINTIPGFTSISMFSMLCAQDGLNYSELLDRIFNFGMDRYKEQKAICYSNKG